jgi:hypothetical protein
MARPTTGNKLSSAAVEMPDLAIADLPVDRSMRALVALLAAEREDRLSPDATPRPAVVVLVGAGLSLSEAASLTGREYEATRGIVRRWKERTAPRSSTPGRSNAPQAGQGAQGDSHG